MSKAKSIRIINSIIFFFGLFFFLMPLQIAAEELQITPPATQIWKLTPGEQVITQFSVTNKTDIALKVTFDQAEYLAIQDKYVYPPVDVNSSSYWLTTETASVVLSPGEQRYIDMLIKVPDNVATGAYTPVLFTTYTSDTAPSVNNTEIQLAPSFKVPINILGEDVESKLTLNIRTDQQMFSFNKPEFSIEAKNTGNTYLSPLLRLQVISPTLDRIYDETLNAGLSLIYPDMGLSQEFVLDSVDMNSLSSLGRYEIQLLGEDSANGVSEFASLTFYVIPLPAVFIAFALLLLGIVMGSLALYKDRKRKQKKTFKS